MLNKPNIFALCLLTQDSSLSKQQIDKIQNSSLSENYIIEYWERSYKNKNQYSGFSHMINEAIDDTNSEFMIFLSGKTSFEPQDIDDIIEKLCSGYCFVAPMSLGLFGTTKELFRNIGVMDERYIGGEMEDDDLALRLNMFGKAVYWMFDPNKYDSSKGNYPLIRGTATGEFFKKWNVDTKKHEAFISKYNTEKQIALRHSKRNLDIYNSWKDKSYSKYREMGGFPGTKTVEYNIKTIDYKEEQQLCSCNITAKISKKQTHITFTTDYNNTYPITFGLYGVENSKRYPLTAIEVYPDTWNAFSYNINNEYYEIRIYSDGNILYNNVVKEDFELSLNLNIFRNIKPI